LTGHFRSDSNGYVPYLYMNPEQVDQMLERIAITTGESKDCLLLKVKTVNHQQSLPKGITNSFKDIPISAAPVGTADAPTKTKKEKPRNALVDVITTELLKASIHEKKKVKFAGVLAGWLLGTSKIENVNIGHNPHPSDNPQDVIDFVAWWNKTAPGYANPSGLISFARQWIAWRTGAGKPKPIYTEDELTPTRISDPNDFTVYDDDGMYIGKGMESKLELDRRRAERLAP